MLKNKTFLSLLVFAVLLAVIFFFRGEDSHEATPEVEKEMGLAELSPPPTEVEEPLNARFPPEKDVEPMPQASVEDSLLTSDEDRKAWQTCVGDEAPREHESLVDWAQAHSAEPPTVHWGNTHFRDEQGKEYRLRYLIDDGPDENPLPRLQLYSVDKEGNPGEILRQENMDYEKAKDAIPTWLAGAAPFYEEKSMTFYFEDGEATIETENKNARTITVTKGAAALICSLKGTASGARCTCRGPDTEYDEEDEAFSD